MKIFINMYFLFSLILSFNVSADNQFPIKSLRLLVGFSPGGASDITSRVVAQKMSEFFNQPVIVDNKPGASGMTAAMIVSKATPDGYTLLSGATSILAINPALMLNLEFDPIHDFSPVSQTVSMAQLLVTNLNLKATSLRDLISLAKVKPGVLNYSSSGNGSSSHLAMELFKVMANVDIVHIPFKGSGQSMPNLMANQVQLAFDPIPTSLPLFQSGKIKVLAISTLSRSNAIPEIETLSEAGVPGYESSMWYGILLPAKTPKNIINMHNKAVNYALKKADVSERFNQLGAQTKGSTSDEFSRLIHDEVIKWKKVVVSSGIKAI